MQAIILAGGRGKRLRPLTDKIPKPLLPIKGVPFLAHLINFAKSQGVDEFILATGYKGEMIRKYFGDGTEFNTKIIYSHEEFPLGTAGPLKKAENLIKGKNILIFNGDTFVEIDLGKMSEFHQKMGNPITIAVIEINDVSRSGKVEINSQNIITKFEEKEEKQGSGFINAGIYILEKEVLKNIPSGRETSLEKEIFPRFAGRISAFKTQGYFIDIGIKKDYQKFNRDIEELRKRIKLC